MAKKNSIIYLCYVIFFAHHPCPHHHCSCHRCYFPLCCPPPSLPLPSPFLLPLPLPLLGCHPPCRHHRSLRCCRSPLAHNPCCRHHLLAALVLFIAHHPHCCHHCPCLPHMCPLHCLPADCRRCCYHHHHCLDAVAQPPPLLPLPLLLGKCNLKRSRRTDQWESEEPDRPGKYKHHNQKKEESRNKSGELTFI